jgi:hypothetical protein
MEGNVLGLRFCNDAGKPADHFFPFQFHLGSAPLPGRAGYASLPLGGRYLSYSRRLSVARLSDSTGALAGYCLGIAIDAAGCRVSDRRFKTAADAGNGFWSEVAEFVTGLAGRYIVLVSSGAETRIYGDACGSYSCVYDPVMGTAGSSLLMALERRISSNRQKDIRVALRGGGRMPFGRTRDEHARVLTANHYLSIPAMTEHRFWPAAGEVAEVPAQESQACLESIRNRLSAVIAGIAATERAALPLSGGNDSRTLLACAKPVLPDIARFYTQVHNYNSRADYKSAARLARAWNFDLERHQQEVPLPEEEAERRIARYKITTGYGALPFQTLDKNFATLPGGNEALLLGNVLEILRASHWRTGNRNHKRLTREYGLRRCKFIGTSGFTERFAAQWMPVFEEWYDGLPADAQANYIDFTFTEQYLGYQGTVLLGTISGFPVFPFNDRRLISLSSRLPLDYRYSNQANQDLLLLAAPELAEIPFARDIQRAKRARRQERES